MEELLESIRNLTINGRYESAVLLIEGVDVKSLFERSFKADSEGEPEEMYFLAYAEEMIIIPGVPIELQATLQSQQAYREVPGTGDDIPISDIRLRQRWIDAVANLAREFNSLVYRSKNGA